jgi:hypothetical protein
MNKTTKVLFAVMLISLFAGSASAVTFTWSDIGSYVADDSTPDIPFTVTGNNSSYTCNLYLNISGTWTAAGTVEATNDTLTSITCNQTLEAWTTYQYNITAYNSTDVPTTHTSSTYTVRYSSFAMLATMVTDMVVECLLHCLDCSDSRSDDIMKISLFLMVFIITTFLFSASATDYTTKGI